MTLRDKFGWKYSVEDYLPCIPQTLAAMKGPYVGWDHFWRLPLDKNAVATSYFLEGDIIKARRYATEMVRDTLAYFFGSWRTRFKTDLGTFDASWWHQHATWMKPLAEALCWATCLDDWASVHKLCEYPTDDCEKDATRTKEERAFRLLSVCYLRNERSKKLEHYFSVIEKGKQQKPKLLAEVIRALQAKSNDRFQNSLEVYLHYFRNSEFKRTALNKLLCFDGTTLVNIGKHEGLTFNVPPAFQDHLIRLS